ncbi:LTA synthase family protein [Flavihumibacter rivuli]|uniref:LTA synthase family protein n=1 Tax=Flavihumibacter rivuli TaxID=2838156 RepID=UPI001BDDEAFC|nr:LTA synthase family protein [Flavihumibacter rivuli]ULQ57286.1 LTA synthase family protein [Flavihumibacter rivuli]
MKNISRIVLWVLGIAFVLLAAMSAARLFTYYTFKLPGTADGPLGRAFWLGFRYDARVVAIIGLLVLLLTLIPALDPFRNKRSLVFWKVFFFIVCLILSSFYIIDFLHYRYLNQRLNASALSFLEDAGISATMVWQTYPVLRLLLGIAVLTWAMARLIIWLYKVIGNARPGVSKRNLVLSWVACFLLLGLAVFGRAGQYPLRWSDAFNMGNDFYANIALNPLQSFFSSFKFRTSSYDLAKVRAAYPQVANYLGVTRPDSVQLNFTRDVAPDSVYNWKGNGQPNVVLVICESFSGYKSSMWGNPLNTTPYFAELCKQGIFFDNCFTPLIGTAKGVWATITGIPDVELVKTASRNPMMVDQHTIINDFKGYEKYYFLGGSTSWANIRGILTNNIQGLHLYEEDDYSVPKIDVWGISDKNLFLEADKVLKKEKHPFFAIIQTADNHRPYTIPEEDREAVGLMQFPKDSLTKYGFESNEELNAFRYTDYCFRKFVEAAKQSPYFQNTIFAFIGDHGIAGNAGPLFPKSWTDNGLSANHVPFLVYAPGKLDPQRIHAAASQVDVMPTLAGVANIPYTNTTLGRDLLARQAADSGQSNKAFIMDYNNKTLGVIRPPYYYNRKLQGKASVMAWAEIDRPQSGEAPASQDFEFWSTAFYETSRYMLLNNKKKGATK